MNEEHAREIAEALAASLAIAMVGSIGLDGTPQIKAMIKAEHDGLRTFWFSTNTSSEHVAQFAKDPRACVYFAAWDEGPWRGLTLSGRMEILRDRTSREHLWQDGCERYYPEGIEDPDYTVLRFTSEEGKLYHALTKTHIPIA